MRELTFLSMRIISRNELDVKRCSLQSKEEAEAQDSFFKKHISTIVHRAAFVLILSDDQLNSRGTHFVP